MKLRMVEAKRGIVWVRQGFRAFLRQPMAFAALFATFMLACFVLALLPVVGPLLALAVLPVVSLGFMLATRAALDGGFPSPRLFIEPLRGPRDRRAALLRLGLIYAATHFALFWIGGLFDSGGGEAIVGSLPASAASAPAGADAATLPSGLAGALLLRGVLVGLLSVPFWHAPALIYWGGQGAAQSMFSSTLACWRNRGAFVAYALAWSAAIIVLSLAGGLLFSLVGSPQMYTVAVLPMVLVVVTVFYASLYFTFADCFAADAALEAVPTTPPLP